MDESKADPISHPFSKSFVTGQSKRDKFMHGSSVCCSGIAWQGQHPLTHTWVCSWHEKRHTDSMKIACNNSKTDQAGEKVSPKNIHANPHEPTMCPILASGAWMSMSREHSMESEKSFLEVLQTGVVRILVGFSQTGRKKLKNCPS